MPAWESLPKKSHTSHSVFSAAAARLRAVPASACRLPTGSPSITEARCRSTASPESVRQSLFFCPLLERSMKKRILIVEDDAGLARVLSGNLSFEGFQVEVVSDGNRALQAARTFAPDLVLLDIMLPGKSGFELCRLWREGARTPIVMLTARADRKDKLNGLKLGADDY